MGMDMYLNKRAKFTRKAIVDFISADTMIDSQTVFAVLHSLDLHLDKPSQEIAYWRKAWSVLDWISSNIQYVSNCCEFVIAKEDLQKLLKACQNKEISYVNNPWSLEEELENTINQIEDVLNTVDFENYEVVFSADW